MGARVNGKMVPLRYKLKNGDIVEILTSPGHHPSRDWLAATVTNRARSKIRHYLNTAEKQQALEIGRKHFERELKRFDLSLKKLDIRPRWRRWPRSWASASRLEDLFAAVGYGKLSMRAGAGQAGAGGEARRARGPGPAASASPTRSSACCGWARTASR